MELSVIQGRTSHAGKYLGQDLVVPKEERMALGRVCLHLLCSKVSGDQSGFRMMMMAQLRLVSRSSVRPKGQTTQEKSFDLKMIRTQPLGTKMGQAIPLFYNIWQFV